ncbi:MAG: arginine repressor [Bacillota bacterium]|jgi:transcriptional regulator of arginine metabolism
MKAKRQRKIQEIIDDKVIETQIELAEELYKQGFRVTQATISRDIKELGLIKVPTGSGSSRYSMPSHVQVANIFERMKRMFRENVLHFDYSENILVIRTLPGSAQAVASCIDHIDWKEIIGSVAGDDTILVVIKPKDTASEVMNKFKNFLV